MAYISPNLRNVTNFGIEKDLLYCFVCPILISAIVSVSWTVTFQTQIKTIALIITNLIIEIKVKVYESIQVQATYLTTLAVSGLCSVQYMTQYRLLNDYALFKNPIYFDQHGIFVEKYISVLIEDWR